MPVAGQGVHGTAQRAPPHHDTRGREAFSRPVTFVAACRKNGMSPYRAVIERIRNMAWTCPTPVRRQVMTGAYSMFRNPNLRVPGQQSYTGFLYHSRRLSVMDAPGHDGSPREAADEDRPLHDRARTPMKKRYIGWTIASPFLVLGAAVAIGLVIMGTGIVIESVMGAYDQNLAVDRDTVPARVEHINLHRNPDDYAGRVVKYRGVVYSTSNGTDPQHLYIVENPVFMAVRGAGGIHAVSVTHYGEPVVRAGDVVTGYGVFTQDRDPVTGSLRFESTHLENHSVNATHEFTYRVNSDTSFYHCDPHRENSIPCVRVGSARP